MQEAYACAKDTGQWQIVGWDVTFVKWAYVDCTNIFFLFLNTKYMEHKHEHDDKRRTKQTVGTR